MRIISGINEPGTFYGQDANYEGFQPDYTDNNDGTITDNVTGLMWEKSPGEKVILSEAFVKAKELKLAGYIDWRVPTIKELYSLIMFSGQDVDPQSSRSPDVSKAFINTKYFDFQYGRASRGERVIDSQYATSTKYVNYTMHGDETMFGVNFADGRIKGYPLKDPRTKKDKTFYLICVRGNPDYGKNNFKDNGDGTITDNATALMWMQVDSGALKAGRAKDGKLNWGEALKWAEELEYAGYSDWRMPNAKELQSIVDYSRSPDTTKSAAIDPIFKSTAIKNEGDKKDFGFYWSGTTHKDQRGGYYAVYIAFGKALGWMKDMREGNYQLLDVHGAGAQRSDPKSGDPSKFRYGHGPQGDVVRIYNFVRLVRDLN